MKIAPAAKGASVALLGKVAVVLAAKAAPVVKANAPAPLANAPTPSASVLVLFARALGRVAHAAQGTQETS